MADEEKHFSLDRALQTVGGILLTVSLAISGWTLLQVVDHDSKIKVIEAKVVIGERDTEALKKDIADSLREIKRQIEKVSDKMGQR